MVELYINVVDEASPASSHKMAPYLPRSCCRNYLRTRSSEMEVARQHPVLSYGILDNKVYCRVVYHMGFSFTAYCSILSTVAIHRLVIQQAHQLRPMKAFTQSSKESIPTVKALEVRAPHDWTQMRKRERHSDHDIPSLWSDLVLRFSIMVLNLAGTTDVIPQKSAASLHVTPGKMAEHLIWDCLIARTVWTTAARPLEKTFPSPYRWSTTVDWTELVLNAYACKQFGTQHRQVTQRDSMRCFKSLWAERSTAILLRHSSNTCIWLPWLVLAWYLSNYILPRVSRVSKLDEECSEIWERKHLVTYRKTHNKHEFW